MWWLREPGPESELPPEIQAIYAKGREAMGFLPNVQRLYAFRPSRFLTWWAHYQDIMRGQSGLSRVEREMIAVVVSNQNDCHY